MDGVGSNLYDLALYWGGLCSAFLMEDDDDDDKWTFCHCQPKNVYLLYINSVMTPISIFEFLIILKLTINRKFTNFRLHQNNYSQFFGVYT